MATESARLSPRMNRCSRSTSPDQGSPRNNNEQSLHILVEPQRDGHMNMITLVSPVSGQIFSQYIAENGACIEIQPGVVFRVPFPQEHNYTPFAPQQFQQAPFPHNGVPYGVQIPGNLFMQRGLSAPVDHNPHCQIHGSPTASNGYLQKTDDGRAERRRDNLQRKLRDKQAQGCNCYSNTYSHSPKMASGPKQTGRRDPKMNGPSPNEPIPAENGGDGNDSDAKETSDDIPVLAAPKATVKDARTIHMSWEDCVANNSHLSDCSFELEMSSKGGAFRAVYCGNEVEHLVDGLSPATEYTFRLRVVIDGKRGRYSEIISAVTPSTTPSAPGLPKVTQKTKTSLLIKWSAPYDGGSVITAYSLQWNGGKPKTDFEEVYNGPHRQYKLSHKLQPSTMCQFRLRACNENGWSGYSKILECMTSACPPDPPEPPQLVEATATTLSLHWVPPKDNGAEITEYRLEMNDETSDYGFKPVFCENKKEFTCVDLLRDTSYKFRLTASNISGKSKYSQIVTYKTLPKAPGRIEKPKVVKTKTQSFTVSWDPPRDTGGPEIEYYIAEICDAKGGEIYEDYRDVKTEYTASGLKPGHTYKVRVYAMGNGGKSEPSPFAHVTTLPVCPCKPDPPRLSTRFKQEPTSIHVEWDSPKDDGGSPISNYILRMGLPQEEEKQEEEIYKGPRTHYSVTGLKPGARYFFKLSANNKAGSSPWSDTAELHTAPGPPDAPEIPICYCKSPTHIRIDWVEPETHGTPVTGFIVEQLQDDIFTKVYEGSCNYCDVKKGLQPATFYYFRVQALSNAGPSLHSPVCTIETLPASPVAISYVRVLDQTSSSALLQWRHPHDNGAIITHYVLEVTGTTTFSVTVPAGAHGSGDTSEVHDYDDDNSVDDDVSSHFSSHDDERSKVSSASSSHEFIEHEVTDLLADTAYRIRVQAVNRIGSSPFSHPVQFVTKELPPSPPNLDLISSSYQSVKLKWGESASPRRNNLGLHFTLQMKNGSGSAFSNVFSGMAQSFSISKLKELSPYTFRINAKNDAGDGSFSEPKTFYTKAQPPHPVKDLAWKRLSSSSAKLTWQATHPVRTDDVTNYIVQRLRVDQSKEFSEVYNGGKTELTLSDLVPDQEYHFRVCAVRVISESLYNSAPNAPSQVKGQFSNILRVRIPVETSVDDAKQPVSADEVKDEIVKKEMSDTQVSLLILGIFLVLGIAFALSLWFFMGEINF